MQEKCSAELGREKQNKQNPSGDHKGVGLGGILQGSQLMPCDLNPQLDECVPCW